MLRATVDTNVWISALHSPHGKPRRLLEALRDKAYVHLTSLAILSELTRVLRSYFSYSDEEAYFWYNEIGSLSEIVHPMVRIEITDDPDDDKFLECAVSGGADYLVSGDSDLLRLAKYGRIRILTAAEFLQVLKSE